MKTTKNFRAFFTLIVLLCAVGQPVFAENPFSKLAHWVYSHGQKAAVNQIVPATPTEAVSESEVASVDYEKAVEAHDQASSEEILIPDAATSTSYDQAPLPNLRKGFLLPAAVISQPIIADIPTVQQCNCKSMENSHPREKYSRADTGSIYATPSVPTYGKEVLVAGRLQLLETRYAEKTTSAGHELSRLEHLEAAVIAAEAIQYDFTNTMSLAAASSFILGGDYSEASIYIKKAYYTGYELKSRQMMCAAVHMNEDLFKAQMPPRSRITLTSWMKKKGRHPNIS